MIKMSQSAREKLDSYCKKYIANGRHISIRIFRLEILGYLSRRSVYFEDFPVGRAKIVRLTDYILSEISDIFG